MKAVVCNKYGPPDALQYENVEKPVPGENEVLIKIFGSSVNYNILALVRGKPKIARLWLGLKRPKIKIPGNDVAGRIEDIGKNVTEFKVGDEVFGDIFECGFGAYAEYVCASEHVLSLKPSNISFEAAGTVPEAALVALHALRDKGQICEGKKVLIYGASGGIGSFAVQLAKSFGSEVTAVCSARNLEFVRSLGADYVIDYTKENFIKNMLKYDLIIAIAGYQSIFKFHRALNPSGIYVCIGGAMQGPKAMLQIIQALLLGPLLSLFGKKKLSALTIMPTNQKDLIFIKVQIESGKIKPIIDRCYPLKEAADALKYYEERHARGKVAIKIEHDSNSD